MGIMDNMMEFMTGRMSKEEKEQMMNKMMEKFFADMTVEDKQKMMNEMMPKMMEGINMAEMMPQMMMRMMGGDNPGEGMMSGMMGMMSGMRGGQREANAPNMDSTSKQKDKSGMMSGFHSGEMSMMPQMMRDMMPHCLGVMLSNLPKGERTDVALKLVAMLIEKGTADMSDEEKSEYIEKIVEQVTTAAATAG